ncbi:MULTISPECIES: 5-methyltetrahydropteroyltriglutamate--homocysteine S-methyltransferase [unclassified Cellulophaga]|uniref:5-methyltetrahydropteroyltriglutamate-- homocysteine S-methyltransferase n=1 Tax=unclassified Cellulophaga TaxID=2634405 RepID=UPI0026E4263F|nr:MULTISPECIES: 5-methyltetrahydropteroyltriglutamate--homocysteine S-methyltransferase [unclassified Cellulophaga]MDO6490323.1 5-methyltetrahydropteroyltriglutamate--homocysteine S-methyltransferase [Cellulophaga sp. 2_MG-2023]MDO6494483.1 5-methyltetrahydropteroyltriglutamate--homocysteine S-methyltransferase [Cellulophaga sp. 3_MG-2023]
MKTNVLGYPRIGAKRELKKVSEKYWKGTATKTELVEMGKQLKLYNWKLMQKAGVDLIPSNDFSFYDQVLDATLTYGCIPARYQKIKEKESKLNLYFAMARGLQNNEFDVTAMEMTKWFDTNYHYLVPEFTANQDFELFSLKPVEEFKEALAHNITTKPVVLSPVTYLLLGKEKEEGFNKIDLLNNLLPVFFELITELVAAGATHVQLDEPCLALNLTAKDRQAVTKLYTQLAGKFPDLKIILTSYFDCYGDNLETVLQLPVYALHLDLVRCSLQLNDILNAANFKNDKILSLGLVDGRNIWKNNFEATLATVQNVVAQLGVDKVWLATSCSLLHTPYDLDLEQNEETLPTSVKQWLAFAKQKIDELVTLKKLGTADKSKEVVAKLLSNTKAHKAKKESLVIHNAAVKARIGLLTANDSERNAEFSSRQKIQKNKLKLPVYPTTTIGSFPQTKEVRSWRSKFKKKELSLDAYNTLIQKEIEETIRFQEKIGLDVLVHGECERNDMVEYFGEKLDGFAISSFGWVQSYGSRAVKPPILFGDVSRPVAMTVKWSAYAQSLSSKVVKGMLTGPVTILQWSFVRNDQPRSETCKQIALAIRDEVVDLEKAGLQAIQVDEPAIREGLPLRKEYRDAYLTWAVESFKIATSGVADKTQIHTHMCYSEFNDIIEHITKLDADVITIETSRSKMDLLNVFVDYKYPNEIGPGVYDIHSPRVPTLQEIEDLLEKASKLLPVDNIWVNPDCGLKTRDWPETKAALENLVAAAKTMRSKLKTAY